MSQCRWRVMETLGDVGATGGVQGECDAADGLRAAPHPSEHRSIRNDDVAAG